MTSFIAANLLHRHLQRKNASFLAPGLNTCSYLADWRVVFIIIQTVRGAGFYCMKRIK